MLTLFDFSQELKKLVKEKKYKEALSYFKENKPSFTNEQISGNEYIVSDMTAALRHTNNFDNAFKFLEIYKVIINNQTKERVLIAYGWLLFSKLKSENLHQENSQIESDIFEEDELMESVANHKYDKSETIERIEKFIPIILNINSDYAHSVFSNLFRSVIKYEKQKPNSNWKFINDFCDSVNSENLSIQCDTMDIERKGEMKKMELASDKENWFAAKSKALIKLRKFQECYDISKQALELFEKFHYSNDIWFARRIALSKKNMGNSIDAISELKEILKRKKEWFIQKELAELYKENGDIENAFQFAISAITNFGDLEYKVDLLFLLGELLKAKNENELAFKHFTLCKLLRISKEWKIPLKLNSELEHLSKENITIDKIGEIKNELRNYWDKFKSNQKVNSQGDKHHSETLIGTIEKILNNNEKGKDGFIKYDQNKTIYFSISSNNEIINKIKAGLKVVFKIQSATCDKKEKAIHLVEK